MDATIDNGIVTITMNGNERNSLQRVLNAANAQNHGDFKDWLLDLRENLNSFFPPVGQGNFGGSIPEDDAKQLQDLTGQMITQVNPAWEELLVEFDNKIHNLWLLPELHFPRP